MSKKSLLKLILLRLQGIGLSAQVGFQQDPMIVSLRAESLEQLATRMAFDSNHWPRIGRLGQKANSPTATNETEDRLVVLSVELHKKLANDWTLVDLQNLSASSRSNVAYALISKALRRSGGYTNLLLADSFHRTVLCRLTRQLLTDNSLSNYVDEELRKSVDARFTLRDLASIISLEPDAAKIEKRLASTPRHALVDEAFAILGTDLGTTIFSEIPLTSRLLSRPDPAALVTRHFATGAVADFELPGLSEFFRREELYKIFAWTTFVLSTKVWDLPFRSSLISRAAQRSSMWIICTSLCAIFATPRPGLATVLAW